MAAEEALTEQMDTWHDVALSIGAELMARVRDEVHTQLHYTTSAVRKSSSQRLLC